MNYYERAKIIGERIKENRLAKHMTPSELLKAVFMSSSSTKTLRKYEAGESVPDPETMSRLCDLFDCDFGYLIGDYNEKHHVCADVCAETGLSESAVYTLGELKGSNTSRSREILKVINLLLDEAHFEENMEFWHLLYAYIWTKPEGSTDINLITVGGEVKVSKESVLSAILENNTAYLKELRKKVSTEE